MFNSDTLELFCGSEDVNWVRPGLWEVALILELWGKNPTYYRLKHFLTTQDDLPRHLR